MIRRETDSCLSQDVVHSHHNHFKPTNQAHQLSSHNQLHHPAWEREHICKCFPLQVILWDYVVCLCARTCLDHCVFHCWFTLKTASKVLQIKLIYQELLQCKHIWRTTSSHYPHSESESGISNLHLDLNVTWNVLNIAFLKKHIVPFRTAYHCYNFLIVYL